MQIVGDRGDMELWGPLQLQTMKSLNDPIYTEFTPIAESEIPPNGRVRVVSGILLNKRVVAKRVLSCSRSLHPAAHRQEGKVPNW